MSARTWGFKSPLRHRGKSAGQRGYSWQSLGLGHSVRGSVVDTELDTKLGMDTELDTRERRAGGRERRQAWELPGSTASTCRRARTAGGARSGWVGSARSGTPRLRWRRRRWRCRRAGSATPRPGRSPIWRGSGWRWWGPTARPSTVANYRIAGAMRTWCPRIGRQAARPADAVRHPAPVFRSAGVRRLGAVGRCPGPQVRNVHRVLHNMLGYARRHRLPGAQPGGRRREAPGRHGRAACVRTSTRSAVPRAAADRTASARCGTWWWSTGLRRAELAGLQWRDVDLDGSPPMLTVRVARTTAGHSGRRVRSQDEGRDGGSLVLDSGTRRRTAPSIGTGWRPRR